MSETERRGEGGGGGDRGVLNMDERVLIFDSQALLDHIDFLQEDPSATNCLILSSVLSQVVPLYTAPSATWISACPCVLSELEILLHSMHEYTYMQIQVSI